MFVIKYLINKKKRTGFKVDYESGKFISERDKIISNNNFSYHWSIERNKL